MAKNLKGKNLSRFFDFLQEFQWNHNVLSLRRSSFSTLREGEGGWVDPTFYVYLSNVKASFLVAVINSIY